MNNTFWVIIVMLVVLFCSHEKAQSAVLFVSKTGDNSDGTSWETAYNSIGESLINAASGDQVWVKRGVYSEAIQMVTGVSLFGGFLGIESKLTERNWEKYLTIIDAEDLNDHTVVAADYNLIDGFTITGGKVENGGGIYATNVTLSLFNCTISENKALNDGGGFYLSNVSLSLKNCSISNNGARSDGGGIFAEFSTLIISQCDLNNNSLLNPFRSQTEGGAIYTFNSTLELSECLISGNESCGGSANFIGDGGGIYIALSRSKIKNTIFSRNDAFGTGGGFYAGRSDLNMKQTIFYDNVVLIFGGGVFIARSSTLNVNGCILYQNSGTQISFFDLLEEPEVIFSNIQGGFTGEGNIDSDPKFVDAENGNFRLQLGSPCIDSGALNGPAFDLDGNPPAPGGCSGCRS